MLNTEVQTRRVELLDLKLAVGAADVNMCNVVFHYERDVSPPRACDEVTIGRNRIIIRGTRPARR